MLYQVFYVGGPLNGLFQQKEEEPPPVQTLAIADAMPVGDIDPLAPPSHSWEEYRYDLLRIPAQGDYYCYIGRELKQRRDPF